MFEKTKQFIRCPNKKGKLMAAAGTAMATATAFMPMAFAAASGSVNIPAIISTMLGIICDIFFAIGLLLLVWSIGMLVLAFKNEDADAKSRAMMMLVVSAALVGFRSFIGVVLNATNAGISVGKGLF